MTACVGHPGRRLRLLFFLDFVSVPQQGQGRALSAVREGRGRELVQAQLHALCRATARLCDAAHAGDMGALNSAASSAASSSGKLMFMFKPRATQDRKNQIVDTASAASRKASELLMGVNQLVQNVGVGGHAGTELDAAGAKVADLATALLTAAQLTALSIEEPCCQSTLLKSVDALSGASEQLSNTWRPLTAEPAFQGKVQELDQLKRLLDQELGRLRDACRDTSSDVPREEESVREVAKLKFSRSVAAAKEAVAAADRELNKVTRLSI
ncbi:hypothetical protein ACJJTC_000096 [Scirpophaga incertulas]